MANTDLKCQTRDNVGLQRKQSCRSDSDTGVLLSGVFRRAPLKVSVGLNFCISHSKLRPVRVRTSASTRKGFSTANPGRSCDGRMTDGASDPTDLSCSLVLLSNHLNEPLQSIGKKQTVFLRPQPQPTLFSFGFFSPSTRRPVVLSHRALLELLAGREAICCRHLGNCNGHIPLCSVIPLGNLSVMLGEWSHAIKLTSSSPRMS